MGHSVKGSPYFIFVPIFAYGPQNANVLSKGPLRVVGRRYNKIINCANDLDKKNKFVHIFISFGQISCQLQVEKAIEFWL